MVEMMLTPGAPKWTLVGPQFEKDARTSSPPVAATEIRFGALKAAGYCGAASIFWPLLPAAATKSISFVFALLISSRRA